MSAYNTPDRLMNEQYLTLSAPYRLFRQELVAGKTISTHWHEFYEMAFIISGTGTHVLNGVSHRISRGDAFLLTPADFHNLIPDPGLTMHVYNLIFALPFLRNELFELLFEHETTHTCKFDEPSASLIELEYNRLWEESQTRQAGSAYVVQGCIERLLIDLFRRSRSRSETELIPAGSSIHPSVRKALIYIQIHFRETLALADVASYSGLSHNYFSECFSKQTGTTFKLYVQELRLQFAKSLLSTTQLPITEVCYASGFGTVPHFEKAFKKKTGISPRDYRKHAADKKGISSDSDPG
ncbi:AraC family transcriptional regulator [Paenibacillus sp.]|uniref:AraC family transcriptional regulator n=1 Tax=Paenibacillus sp. TaxID=58172 RepID=UPI002D293E7F|nr:AraC family transcriptional regulator [Paenibacillus sp.]HZG56242.1 AraC family transcriptional regulator [Paenibacillus sp.]